MDGAVEFHEISNLFPPMAEQDFQELKADIQANGLRESIVVYDGKIIDGRHRYRACIELGIKPRFRQWDAQSPLLQYVLSMNLHRRHMTTSQRALLGAELRALFEKSARRRQGTRTDLRADLRAGNNGKASEQAARLVNVSARSVESATAVKKLSDPQLVKAVRDGLVSISTAALIAKLPAGDQQKILALESKSKMRHALSRYRQQAAASSQGLAEHSGLMIESMIRDLEHIAEVIGEREPRLIAEAFVRRFPFDDMQQEQRFERVLKVARLLAEIDTIRGSANGDPPVR